ncbi:MAG: VWA domain-containing protein [Clostridia bacterium]|nr:VWA domain-containing protein [Clostridia bacterium]
MKKFSLLVTVFILICFMLTACGTTAEDILGALTGNSILSVEVTTGSSAGVVSSQVPTQSTEDSSETSRNNSITPIYPMTSSVGKVSPSKVNSQSIPTQTESTAIVLLIDRSEGMAEGDGSEGFVNQYGATRLEYVRQAVDQMVTDGLFSEKDYVGIIFFGGNKNTPIEALQLTPASNVLGISRAIYMDITFITGGQNYLGSTEWRHALESAANMLKSFRAADNKHIFMITDGSGDKAEGEASKLNEYPVGGWKYFGEKLPSGYSIPAGIPDKCYTDYIYDTYGITTSTLNVACPLSPAKEYIAELERNGATYYAQSPQDIQTAIKTECYRIKGKTTNLPETSVPSNSSSDSSIITSESYDNSSSSTPDTSVDEETSFERAFISQDLDANGIVDETELAKNKTRTDSSDGFFSLVGASGGASQSPACVYSDSKNQNVSLTRIFKGAVQFSGTQGGVLTFYPRNYTRVQTYIITIDSVAIDGEWVAETSAPVTVVLPRSGLVKVTTKDGDLDAAFFAVKYSYSN